MYKLDLSIYWLSKFSSKFFTWNKCDSTWLKYIVFCVYEEKVRTLPYRLREQYIWVFAVRVYIMLRQHLYATISLLKWRKVDGQCLLEDNLRLSFTTNQENLRFTIGVVGSSLPVTQSAVCIKHRTRTITGWRNVYILRLEERRSPPADNSTTNNITPRSLRIQRICDQRWTGQCYSAEPTLRRLIIPGRICISAVSEAASARTN